MTVVLPPCPFCDSSSVRLYGLADGGVTVLCDDCGARGPAKHSDEEAAEAWMSRAVIGVRNYTWIGDDCPPGWRHVGSIDVADPADTASARDRCLRIGTIYDGGTYSVAEPCAADVYDEVATKEDANVLASQVERMADNPKGGASAARAYIQCARLIRRKLGSVRP